MSIAFRNDHLAAFEEKLDDCPGPDEPGMKKFSVFANAHPDVDGTKLSGEKVKRSEVFALAEKCDVNEATVCAAAMAWGAGCTSPTGTTL